MHSILRQQEAQFVAVGGCGCLTFINNSYIMRFINKLFMEYRAVKEKRSLLKNISASWDIISLGGNVLKFRGGRSKGCAAW